MAAEFLERLIEIWRKSRLAKWWCKSFHRGIINLTSTQYECAKCLRVHSATWLAPAFTQTQEKAPRLFICLHCFKHFPNLAFHYQTTECGDAETMEILQEEHLKMYGKNSR